MISFFCEDISFKLSETRKIKSWLKATAAAEGCKVNQLNYIFCSDEYLLNINKQYLNHDYYTDIITFDNSEIENEIEGDIFISIERVVENAALFKKTFDEELKRVLIHGVLHLIGYGDKTTEEKHKMRAKENFFINQYQ